MTQHDRNLSHLIKQTKFCNFGMLKNLPYVVIPAHNAEIQIYRNGLNEKLLDKPRQPPYYDNKGIYDSKLVFDLQAQWQNSVKNSEYLLADYIKL